MHFREQIAAFLAAVTQNSVFRTEEKVVLSNFVFLGWPAWYHKETVITTQTFSCFILPERLSFKKKKEMSEA